MYIYIYTYFQYIIVKIYTSLPDGKSLKQLIHQVSCRSGVAALHHEAAQGGRNGSNPGNNKA